MARKRRRAFTVFSQEEIEERIAFMKRNHYENVRVEGGEDGYISLSVGGVKGGKRYWVVVGEK